MHAGAKRPFVLGILGVLALLAVGCVTKPPTAAPPPRLVEAGGVHTCAVDQTRQVACWGQNNKGQLGVGTFVDSASPLFVPGMVGVTAVTASFEHSCAIKAGAVYCWGSNSDGQLGDGTTIDRPSPVLVAGLSNITRISTGIAHSCAVDTARVAWCWGDNGQGQLGDGTTVDSLAPVQVTGITDVVSISVKGWHSCALTTSGAARCWGDNSNGQLGIGTTVDSTVPVAPSGISTASALEAGTLHTCARVGAATSCWGNNTYGQLGDGTTTGSLVPVAVSGLGGATKLALGAFHSCAVVSGGEARCWGYNLKGGLGDGSTVNSATPVAVVGLANITHISAGLYHTCAVVASTQVKCWGDNSVGQLGNTTVGSESAVPVSVQTATVPPPVLPPNNISTVTNYDLDCQAYLGGNPVQAHTLAAETSTSHPEDVLPGQSFHVVVSSADIDVPLTYPPGVTLQSMSNFSLRVAVPDNATLLAASFAPGVNVGTGSPTVTDHGTYVQLNVPGPLTPGTTATLPTLELDFQASGASGETIDFLVPGTSYVNWDYAFNVTLAGVGTVVNQCFVDPSPVLGSTQID